MYMYIADKNSRKTFPHFVSPVQVLSNVDLVSRVTCVVSRETESCSGLQTVVAPNANTGLITFERICGNILTGLSMYKTEYDFVQRKGLIETEIHTFILSTDKCW